MSFDTSRFLFDPTHDYLGVVMQQGRVQLDADWNEWLLELSRRLQSGTLDLVGRAGVPAGTPAAFKINAFVDAAGPHLTIGSGRIYVDGLMAENHGPATTQPQWDPALAEFSAAPQLPNVTEVDVDYTLQPYLPSLTLFSAQTANKQFLVYLDVWQRDITALQDPTLIDPAVGVDTTARRQTVWQVKLLDVTGLGFTAATPEAQIPGRAADPAVAPWANLLQPSGGLLTTATGGAQITAPSACALSPTTGYTGLENQLYRVEIHQANPAAGTATFKWSRENASVVTLVTAIATVTNAGASQSQLTVQTLGRDQVLGFNPGDWVEITDDFLELSGQSGELHLITAIDPQGKTITLDSAVSTTSFPLTSGLTTATRHTRIVRWDQAGTVYLADGSAPVANLDTTGGIGISVPSPGTALLLESGISVAFDLNPSGGFFQPGDFWTFAARTADSSIQTLTKATSQGSHHHYARLATVDFAPNPPAIIDLRRAIPVLASPAIHVVNVQSGSTVLTNDATVTIQSLVNNGLTINFDAPLDPAVVIHPVPSPRGPGQPAPQPNNPVCVVALDLPSPAGAFGFTHVTLPSTVSVVPPNILQWKHAIPQAAVTPFQAQIPPAGPAVLARLTLKGSAIWASANPSIFLNGANNGRPSADYEIWFWLISQPIATLNTSVLQFGTQLVGGPTTAQSILLTNNASPGGSPLVVSGISVPAPFTLQSPQVPPNQSIAPGSSLTISVTFNPTAPGQFNNSQMTITEGADPSPLQVTLTGTAIAPTLSANLSGMVFPSNTIVGSTVPQTVRLTCGGSQVTIVALAILPPPGGTLPINPFQVQTVTPQAPIVLQPSGFIDIPVNFHPVLPGNYAAQLAITSNAAGTVLFIPISAGAIAGTPAIIPSANALAFGTILVGASSTLTINFTNTGNATLIINGVSTIGAQPANFVPSINLTTIAPTQAATVTVTFKPSTATSFSATLQIIHNAGAALAIGLTGAGFVKKAKETKEAVGEKSTVIERKAIIGDKASGLERVAQFRPAILAAPAVEAAATPAAATQHSFITPAERPQVGPQAPEPTPPEPQQPEPPKPAPVKPRTRKPATDDPKPE